MDTQYDRAGEHGTDFAQERPTDPAFEKIVALSGIGGKRPQNEKIKSYIFGLINYLRLEASKDCLTNTINGSHQIAQELYGVEKYS